MNTPNHTIPSWLVPHVAEVESWGPVAGTRATCWVGGCEREASLWGLCQSHRKRAKRAWNPSPSEEERRRAEQAAVARTSDSETKTSSTNTTA